MNRFLLLFFFLLNCLIFSCSSQFSDTKKTLRHILALRPKRINDYRGDKDVRYYQNDEKTVKMLFQDHADLFQKNGFSAAAVRYYNKHNTDKNARYRVSIYQMETPFHAYQIYSSLKPMEKDLPPNISMEAYLLARKIVLWKNRYYIVVNAMQESYNTMEELRRFGKALSNRISGDFSLRTEIKIFHRFSQQHDQTLQPVRQSPPSNDTYGKPVFLKNKEMDFFPDVFYGTLNTYFDKEYNLDFYLILRRLNDFQAQTIFYKYKTHLENCRSLKAWQYKKRFDYIYGDDTRLNRVVFFFRIDNLIGGFFYPFSYEDRLTFKNVLRTFNASYLSKALDIQLTHPTLETERSALMRSIQRTDKTR